MVTDDHDDDEPEGLGTLIIDIGAACTGYEVGTVMTALLYFLVDCAAQGDVPKHEFLAQAYESLDNLFENKENDNGRSTYN